MNKLTAIRNRTTSRRGFSLAETLIVVGILLVLLALLIPNLIKTQKELRQKELDAKAEIIYVAAQNQLAKLRAVGSSKLYANLRAGLSDTDGTRVLATNAALTTAESAWLGDALDGALSSGHWVIVYNARTGAVLEVYYSEKGEFNEHYQTLYKDDTSLPIRQTKRFLAGANVGFYNGSMEGMDATETVELRPTLDVVNGEKLIVTGFCPMAYDVGNLSFKFVIKDMLGGTFNETPTVTYSDTEGGYIWELVLDDLSSEATRFYRRCNYKLKAGSPLTMTLTVSSSDPDIEPGDVTYKDPLTGSSTFNSLFANSSAWNTSTNTLTADIACGRHLQNLDSLSEVAGPNGVNVYQANQTDSIDFGEDSPWAVAYGNRKFTPITNAKLTGYNGMPAGKSQATISNLNADSDGNSGLFAEINNSSGATVALQNIRLISSKVKGSTNVGALAGKVTGACTVTNCGAYLDDSAAATLKNGWNPDIWFMNQSKYMISGGNVGGLVGSVDGSLSITGSFAATVLHGTNAGGLVGTASPDGTLTITTSYADCHVAGVRTGGLVGGSSSASGFSSVASLTKSYAAGFLCPTMPNSTSAGLVNGSVGTLESCYTACDLGDAWLMYPTAASCDAVPTNLFYFYGGNMPTAGAGVSTARELGAALTDSAFKSSGMTKAYNLDGGNRKNYGYLHLDGNEMHYGDWKEGIQQGSFVYYEYYNTGLKAGKYGIAFAGDSSLDTQYGNTVFRDGYAVALEKGHNNPIIKVTLKEAAGGTTTYSSAPAGGEKALTVVRDANCGGTLYDLYCLPANAVNAAPADAGFYQLATVQVGPNESYYYFNPHFAATSYEVVKTNDALPAPVQPSVNKDTISVRTARQLFCMSLYYDSKYYSATIDCTFLQERDIDYKAYDWATCGGDFGTVSEQEPIGAGGNVFNANYNGDCHTISHVGITSRGLNVGLFGRTVRKIENIFFVNSYYGSDIINDNTKPNGTPVDYVIKELHKIGTNESYNIGALVGTNSGTIRNCAVAGFRLMGSDDINDNIIYTYTNSTISIGGLVGRNNGLIFNCSVVMPGVSVDSIFSNVSIGGFTGTNRGDIRNSYAIGVLDATEKESTVTMGGFAGTNAGGQITGSYCAVATNGSGTINTYGFAPRDGSVSDCQYLDKGTYSFVGGLHSYDGGLTTAGSSITYNSLAARNWTAEVTQNNSRNHERTTLTPTVTAYPFPGKVSNGYAYVHFGDWLTAPDLGEYGLFYWEQETGGANPGYHFSCVGRLQSNNEWVDVTDTTLCAAHDDGGTISKYGYGYYLIGMPETVEAAGSSTWVLAESADGTIKWSSGVCDSGAKASLQQQMPGYTFYPFTTNHVESGSYIYLNSGYVMGNETSNKDRVKGTPQADGSFGKWTLKYYRDNELKESHAYYFTPFFANTMVSESKNGAAATYAPGSAAHKFEIRSVKQLRYINWNITAHNTDTLVDTGNYTQFPFLQYCSTTGTNDKQNTTTVFNNRPRQSWEQTHDLHGGSETGYTPIAAKRTSSGAGSSENKLYAWFGGDYNGKSYKIQNLDIISDSYTVGLFGVTVGAEIKNIIMYGDGNNVVERNTANGSTPGAYQLGGMIGLAYDYDTSNQNSVKTITNCAIAGYRVVDNSKNAHGLGYASVGGLFGISQVKLERCSAVVDIEINYRSPTSGTKYSSYGNMVRVGGLTGTALYRVYDCYTGGSITVDDGESSPDDPDYNSTLFERPEGFNTAANANNDAMNRNKSLQIFIGGIAGSSYRNGVQNFGFSGNSNATDGSVEIQRCYTYMELPKMEGNIYAVSVIAGAGDRFKRGTKIDLTSCYFLENKVLKNYPYTLAEMKDEHASETGFSMDFHFKKDSTVMRNSLTYGEIRDILFGNLDILSEVLEPHAGTSYRNPSESAQFGKDYAFFSSDALTNALGSGTWHRVTLVEHNNAVNGKYSFSSEPDQKGKDYPFPAVIKQDDNTWVHYGRWARDGAYWAQGRGSMDIFDDRKETSVNPGMKAVFTREITLGDGATFPENTTFSVTPGSGVAADAGIVGTPTYTPDRMTATVTIEAKVGGTLTLTGGADTVLTTTSIRLTPAEKDFTEKLVQSVSLDAPVTSWTRSTAENAETGVEDETFDGGGLRFTLSPAGKAEVVKVESVDEGKALKVWLRAIAPGTVSVTDDVTGASCYVSITQNLSVIASDDTIQLTLDGAEDKIYSCEAYPYAVAQTPEAQTEENRLTRLGEWRITGAADSIRVTQQTGNNSNKFKVTYVAPDDTSVTAQYTYYYFGTEISAAKVIQVRTMGYFGLADGTRAREVKRGLHEVQFEPLTYPNITEPQGADVFLYAPLSEGDLADFTITATADDGVTVSMFTEKGHPLIIQDTENGFLYIGMTLRSTDGYKTDVTVHVHLHKSAGVNEDPDDLDLELSGLKAYQYQLVFDGNGGTGTMRPVGFTENAALPANQFTRAGYRFDGWKTSGGEINYADGMVLADTTVEPEDGEPYEVKYYTTLHNLAEASTASPKSVTLYAQWKAVNYTVYFDPYDPFDYKPEQIVSRGYRYDEDQSAGYESGITLPSEQLFSDTWGDDYSIPDGMQFNGWNTDFRGRGTSYSAGHIDDNLTDVDGAVITLFAQWRQATYDLTLYYVGADTVMQSETVTIENGQSALPAYPTEQMTASGFAQEINGWKLTGWYTVPEEGSGEIPVLLIDANGNLSPNVSGYTAAGVFAVDEARSLQARWQRTAYFQVDKLDKNAADNGTYLIASGNEGQVYLAENDEKGDPNSTQIKKSASQYTVREGTFLNASGKYILDNGVLRTDRWTITFADLDELDVEGGLDSGRFNKNYRSMYWIQNCNERYLRHHTDNPKVNHYTGLKKEPKYESKGVKYHSNRNCFTYGTVPESAVDTNAAEGSMLTGLYSQFALMDTKSKHTFGWNSTNSRFDIALGLNCYLFKQCIVYTLVPSALS